MRTRGAVTALVVLVVIVGLCGHLARKRFGDVLSIPDNTASCQVGDGEVRLDSEQMANASTIAAVGTRLKVPDRAIVVALATALQESKLRNLGHLGRRNDHDSLGLFQQRPSQGWGSADQILDQRYAAGKFYDELLDVKGWENMRVTEAAQRVQRSAHPEAYERWADQAAVLASALTGRQQGSLTCSVPDEPVRSGAEAVRVTQEKLKQDFGPAAPKIVTGTNVLHISAKDTRMSWQFAHWLVAQAPHTGVTRVHYADKEWARGRHSWSSVDNVADQVTAEVEATP